MLIYFEQTALKVFMHPRYAAFRATTGLNVRSGVVPVSNILKTINFLKSDYQICKILFSLVRLFPP